MSDVSQEQLLYNYEQLNTKIQKLTNAMKIKDQALQKASQIINLLRQEVQTTKKSASDAFQDMQKTLKCQYQIQIQQLRSRIQFLQRQIKRKNGQDRSIKKHSRIPTLILNPSQTSFDNTKQRTRVASSRIITSIEKQQYQRTPKANKTLLKAIKSQKNLTVPGLAVSEVRYFNNKNFSIEGEILKQYVHQQIKQTQLLLELLSETANIEEQIQDEAKKNLQIIEDQLNEYIFSGKSQLRTSNYSKQSPNHKISQQISEVLCSYNRGSAMYQSQQQIGYSQIVRQQQQIIKNMKNTIQEQAQLLKSYQSFIQAQNNIRLTDTFSQKSSSTNKILAKIIESLKKDNDILTRLQNKTRAFLQEYLKQISIKAFKDQQHIYSLAKQCQQLRAITEGMILIIKKQNLLINNNISIPMYKMSN